MNGKDKDWFKDYLDAEFTSIRQQISNNHGTLITLYEDTIKPQVIKNTKEITTLKEETSFFRMIQRNPVKSIIIFAISVIIITTVFNWNDVLNFAKHFLTKL